MTTSGMATMLRVLPEATVRLSTRYRTDAVICLILFTLVVLSWFPRLDGPIDLRRDASVYYILGTSLAEGKGYRLLNEPGEIEAVQYPPLLPLIVAAHQIVLGTNDPVLVGQWLRLSFFLIFAVYIFAVCLMLRHYLPLTYAFLGTLVCLFNLYTYLMSNMLVPEVLFGLATVLCVLCNDRNSGRISRILAGFFAVAAYALRTIGIALLVAWVAESLFKRQFKKAAVRLTVSIIPILCWQSYIYSVESGTRYHNPVYEYQRADYLFYNVSYTKNVFRLKDSFSPELGHAAFADLAERFANNLARLPIHLGEGVGVEKKVWKLPFHKEFPAVTWWFANSALFFLGSLILVGIGVQVVRRQWIIPLYILLSLAAMCLTPWPIQFVRYVTPLSPFFALSLFTILLIFRERSRKGLPTKKVAGLIVTTAIVFLVFAPELIVFRQAHRKWLDNVVHNDQNGKKIEYRVFGYFPSERALDAGLDWLKSRAEAGAVVAATMAPSVYLRTGLKAVMPPFELNPITAQHLLDSVPVSYLFLEEGFAKKYTSRVVQKFPDQWERVYSVPDVGFEIYKRVNR